MNILKVRTLYENSRNENLNEHFKKLRQEILIHGVAK